MSSVFTTLNQVLGIYALLVCLIGTFLNIFIFFVCMRIKNNTTFVFLRFFALVNICTLYWWNLNHFFNAFSSINLPTLSKWGCKIGNYIQFSSLQIAAWFLVLISVDGVLSVYFRHWKTVHFKVNRAYMVSILVVLFFLLLNTNILVLFGYEAKFNDTVAIFCFRVEGFPDTYWMDLYGKIHLFIYSLVPFIILFISNLVLVLKLKSRRLLSARTSKVSTAETPRASMASTTSSSRSTRTIKIVVAITTLFILFTLPVACSAFFFTVLFQTDYGVFMVTLFDCISFTYFGCNFFISLYTNLLFKKELFRVFSNNFFISASHTQQRSNTLNQQ